MASMALGERHSICATLRRPGWMHFSRPTPSQPRYRTYSSLSISARYHPATQIRPIRPSIAADGPAICADHARSKGLHGHVVAVLFDVKHGTMATFPTRDIEPAHAVLAHVAERHRRAGVTGRRPAPLGARPPAPFVSRPPP